MDNKYKFKFSIIMSIYNSGQWLEEAVVSLISQDIGFEENVQIIFVNDGSSDNSEEICLRYQKMYPRNITYKKKKNGGVSLARNLGLRFVKGQYVNFFDPDDIMTDKTLSSVANFYNSQGEYLSLVSIPLVYFEKKQGLHPKYELLGSKSRIIDLDNEPYSFILSCAASFYKAEVFERMEFNNFRRAGDMDFNLRYFVNNRKFGFVCEEGAKYLYRIRDDGSSISDSYRKTVESIEISIKIFDNLIKNFNKIPGYLQEAIIFDMRGKINFLSEELFNNRNEYSRVIEKYRFYISKIDPLRLAKSTPYISTKAQRYVFLSKLLETNPLYVCDKGYVCYKSFRLYPLANLNVFVRNISFFDKHAEMDVLFFDFNISGIEIVVKDQYGKYAKIIKEETLNTVYDLKYGDFKISSTNRRTFKIPYGIKDTTFKIYIRDFKNGSEYKARRIKLHSESPFILNQKHIKVFRSGIQVRFYDGRFVIQHKQVSQLRYNIISTFKIWKHSNYKYFPLLRLTSSRHKKYILLNDRPIAGGDNAEALFEFISKKDSNMAKYTYFVLDKGSPDFARVKKIGKVVSYGSIKHAYLQLNAKFIISSHLHILFKTGIKLNKLRYYQDMLDSKFIWLQHGVSMNNIERAVNRFHRLADGVVVATKHEEREFLRPSYFYSKEQILKTGFPRYDRLFNNSQNIITVMPTWRNYLTGKVLASGLHSKIDNFTSSSYYVAYKKLLTDKKLLSILEANNYKLRFILHPGMSKYIDEFSVFENDFIEIIQVGQISYSEAFATSKLLITDWSSVFFDFVYLGKPVLFFQFDKADFRDGHYKEGVFSYEKMGPGPIFEASNDLIKELEVYIKSDCKMKPKFKKRADGLFLYDDNKNSERVYKAILKMDKSR